MKATVNCTPPTGGAYDEPSERLLKSVDIHVKHQFAKSELIDRSGEFPRFQFKELQLGKVLGKGGFGTVWEITAFLVDESETREEIPPKHPTRQTENDCSSGGDDDDDDVDAILGLPTPQESRKFIAQHCLRQPSGHARYAIKKLSPEVVQKRDMLARGMMDMVIETRFLSDIEHPNIVKLRAIAATEQLYSPNYFIVMDRLYDTLEKRIEKWSKMLARHNGILKRLSDPKGLKTNALYQERVKAAFDLAAALGYLHERNIVYRDLKPENIGFDIRDDIKIFDFGLAKELTVDLKNEDGTYRLTPLTGSLRYMAPEVANSQPYNTKCDSYSFAIVLWQMLHCKVPYEMYTPKSLREKVYNGANRRPIVDESLPSPIKLCLKLSWLANFQDRHTMDDITLILRKECVRTRDGDDTGLEHRRRRSTFVMRRK